MLVRLPSNWDRRGVLTSGLLANSGSVASMPKETFMKLSAFLILAAIATAQTPAVCTITQTPPANFTCSDAVCGPYMTSTNFTIDITGTQDNRAATWGTTGAQTWRLPFCVPAGYRVRILHVQGDLIAMVRQPAPRSAGTAGVLWGLQSTVAPDQGDSPMAAYCGDGTFLYVQGVLTPTMPLTRTVDYDVSAGGLLGPDNILLVKVATFLSTIAEPLHLEPTWTMKFQLERQ